MSSLKVVVRKREGVEFEGEVYAISSINEIGTFDVLLDHANFVTKIKEKIVIHHNLSKREEILISTGILHAKENLIEIFLGI